MKHHICISEQEYEQILSWEITFLLLKNDKGYQRWDTASFIVFNDEKQAIEIESDLEIHITNVFQQLWRWLEHWFCILSFKKLENAKKEEKNTKRKVKRTPR
jgi:hypothetical protein